jgi:hypothetical protein
VHKEPGRGAARRPGRPPLPGRPPSRWHPCASAACHRGRSSSRHPSPCGAPSRSAGRSPPSSPPTTTAILLPPGSRSSTSVTCLSHHSAEQAPLDITRVGTHGAAPAGGGTDARPWQPPQHAGSVRPGSAPALWDEAGRIGVPVLVHASFTSRSGIPTEQEPESKNQTGWGPRTAAKSGASAFDGRRAVQVAGRAPSHRSGALPGTPA